MNPLIRERWVNALRSGRYVQGVRQLRTLGLEPRYCCLGVLCELAAEDGIVEFVDDAAVDKRFFAGRGSILPDVVVTWAGLDSPNPSVFYDRVFVAALPLGAVNDRGVQFDIIARLIEEQL